MTTVAFIYPQPNLRDTRPRFHYIVSLKKNGNLYGKRINFPFLKQFWACDWVDDWQIDKTDLYNNTYSIKEHTESELNSYIVTNNNLINRSSSIDWIRESTKNIIQFFLKFYFVQTLFKTVKTFSKWSIIDFADLEWLCFSTRFLYLLNKITTITIATDHTTMHKTIYTVVSMINRTLSHHIP